MIYTFLIPTLFLQQKIVKVLIDLSPVLEKDDTSREKNKFIHGFSDGEEDSVNVTELSELGRPLGEKILKDWMDKLNRNLTNSQVLCHTF